MRTTIICLGLLVAGCELSGCAMFSGESNPGAELSAVAKPPVADLPVPADFKLDEDRSRSCDSGVARFVDHLYWGSASKFAVSRFYKKAMIARKWRFVSETFSLGDQDLQFKKPGETCKVTISSGSWLHPTKLKLQLWTSELKKAKLKNPPANDSRTGQ